MVHLKDARVRTAVLCLALLLALGPPSRASLPVYATGAPWTFSGRVLEGTKPLEPPESLPAADVRLKLYGSNTPGVLGVELTPSSTNNDGWFELTTTEVVWEFFSIVLIVPRTYSAGGCSSVGGSCLSDTWIQYAYPYDGKILSSNRFWILPPATATPVATATPTPSPSRTATTVPPTATRTNTSWASSTPTRTSPPATATASPTLPRYTPTPTATHSSCRQLLDNGGFETGSFAPWEVSGPAWIGPGHESEFSAWLAGTDGAVVELTQGASISSRFGSVPLTFWWLVESEYEQPRDRLRLLVRRTGGEDLLGEWQALAPFGQWRPESLDLSAYIGQSITLVFLVFTDARTPSTFRVDDVSLLGCGAGGATPTPTLTTQPGSPVVLDLCARAETWINELKPTWNYGANSTMEVGFGAGQNEPFGHRYGLVRFELDFLPPGTVVDTAYLLLGLQSAGGVSSVQIPIYAVGDPWDEMSVTWATQPNILPDIVTTAYVGSTPYTTAQWDIRALVQHWVNGDLPNHGLELRGPESAFWQRVFEAGIYSGLCPGLHLEVRAPVPFPTPTSIPTLTPTITPTPVCLYSDAAGNTFSTASLLPSANISYTEEYICPSNDWDYWKFHVDSNQWISITLNHWLTNIDTDIYLYPPAGGQALAKSLNPAGMEDSIEYWAYVPGDWVVLVTGKYASDWSKDWPYRLRVSTCIDDQAGNTFQAARVISTSLPAAGTQWVYSDYICPQGDEDWWQFSMPGGQTTTVTIKLTNLPADYRIELWDSDQKLQKYNYASGTGNKTITWTVSPSWVPLGGFPSNWRVRVYGAPSGSGSAYHTTQPYHLEVSMAGAVDLTIQELEVTQGIQDLNNSVAQVNGKLTRARVYVGVSPPVTSLSDLVVRLYGWSGNYNGTALPGSPLTFGPATYAVTSTSVTNMRLALGSTFNFPIPSTWLTHGTLYLRAEVNPGEIVPETNYANNYLMDSVKCGSCDAVNLALVAVTSGGITVSLQSSLVTQMLSYFKDAYPMSQLNVWTLASGAFEATRNYAAASSQPGVCSSAWGDLAGEMSDFYDNWSNRPAHAFVYGLLNQNVPHCAPTGGCHLGCSSGSGNGSCGILSADAGETLAHEVGHTLGRAHAPCGLGGATPDSGWPNGTNPGAIIGQVGVRWTQSTVYGPNTPDLMSYCNNAWISPYTYWGLWGGLCGLYSSSLDAASTGAPAPHVIVAGQISGDTVVLRPFWVQDYPAGEHDAPGEGPYSIELRNASGSALFVRRFALAAYGEDPHHAGDRFHEILPFYPGTARIVLRHGDLVLAAVEVSAHKPTVTLLNPNGGESWDGPGNHTITWSAEDADGDPLVANLLYSGDGGTSWMPLALGVTGSSYVVNAGDLPGSNQALVMVRVTDGVNTAEDASDAPFRVGFKPPLAFVLGPENGATLPAGAPVAFSGLATDPEDGPLHGEALLWVSDRDGLLGHGDDIAVESLSPGAHRITLSVADGDGLVGSSSITVYVGQRHLYLPVLVRRP